MVKRWINRRLSLFGGELAAGSSVGARDVGFGSDGLTVPS